jgi:hypothetical protein
LPCQGGRAGSIPAGRSCFRTWESLGFRVPRAHEIAGSNPAVLTYCGGTRAGTGRRLLTAPTQVRFLPPQLCALGRAAKVPCFQPGKAGSIPAGHSRGSANGRLPGFEPGDAGSSPAPRTLVIDAGSSNGRTGRSERSGVGSIPAPATYKRKSSGRMRSLSRKQVR